MVAQRGREELTWMMPNAPFGTYSVGRYPHVPQIPSQTWNPIADELFPDGANCLTYSDGAQSYSYKPAGFLAHHTATHGEQIYSRPVQVPMYKHGHEPCEYRMGKAGCQKCEGAWSHIIQRMPPELHSPTNANRKAVLDRWIRAAQWKYISSTRDAWEEFAIAAGLYAEAHRTERGV